MISIVTPWRDHPELIPAYERAVQAWAVDNAADWGRQMVEVIVIDTGSTDENLVQIVAMVKRLRGSIFAWFEAFSFAAVCNHGLARARGDIVLFLNNDVVAEPGWLEQVARDVRPGALYGASQDMRVVAGQPMIFLEGWCLAARRETWDALGGWDSATFQRPYWEDVDLSWRAIEYGLRLVVRPWTIRHLGNTTSRTVPGAYDHSEANQRALERKMLASRAAARGVRA